MRLFIMMQRATVVQIYVCLAFIAAIVVADEGKKEIDRSIANAKIITRYDSHLHYPFCHFHFFVTRMRSIKMPGPVGVLQMGKVYTGVRERGRLLREKVQLR